MMRKTLLVLFFACCAEWLMAAGVTGSLPVVYIRTANGEAITSKDTYLTATLYIDPLSTGQAALGTSAAPVSCKVKGRGNWTWSGFDKKPYRIKLDVKQKVLGMPNNRHWCLMAEADDYLGYLKNTVGFMLSRAIGLRWTPRRVPVELVINGEYKGLYFLTEHVRIAANRVHIHEQAEGETHADSITGGWLVEIDNYPSENNIVFYEGNGQEVMVSLREPDSLSTRQCTYLTNQLTAINERLYGSSESQLQQLLDFDEAAKYYLVQEIMEDCESYHGSCFLYKDRDSLGTADKWKFGPVWDFGNAYNRHQEKWIYIEPSFDQYWIGQLATWPAFQQKVKEYWYVFYHDQQDTIRTQIDRFVSSITRAAKEDAKVWNGTQGYCNNSDMAGRKTDFLSRYNWRIEWLYSQWGEGIRPATYDCEPTANDKRPTTNKILRNGQLLIIRDGVTYDILGRPINNSLIH